MGTRHNLCFFTVVFLIGATPLDDVSAQTPSTSPETTAIAGEYAQAVVKITTPLGDGSGFIIQERGFILTCAHVIKGKDKAEPETSITVTQLNNQGQSQAPVPAKLVAFDPYLDVALLKIPGKTLRHVGIGDSNINPGDSPGLLISLIGYTLGGPEAKRDGGITGFDRERGWWETDAAMYKGNSGGPVFDRRTKEVIAIARGGWGTAFQSVNFMIPINYANNMLRLAGILTERKTLADFKKMIDDMRLESVGTAGAFSNNHARLRDEVRDLQVEMKRIEEYEIKPGQKDIHSLKKDTLKENDFKTILLQNVERHLNVEKYKNHPQERLNLVMEPVTDKPITLLGVR